MWGRPPGHSITEANAESIRLGMLEDEVVQLLGVPAGNYTTGPWAFGTPADNRLIGDVGSLDDWKVWAGDDVLVSLGLDKGGRVQIRRIRRVVLVNGERVRHEDNLLDRFRSWLKHLGL